MKSYTNKGSLISYEGLIRLVEDGVITGVKPENINGASIDITLHDEILRESESHKIVSLWAKENIAMERTYLIVGSNSVLPNEFILASTAEFFHLPDNIAAEYKLKSSMARNGLDHALAGWCDPSWHGRLTMEFKNITRNHTLQIKPGMKIGQMVFWECDPVPAGKGYDVRGQYNGQETVTQSKGIR